MSILKKIKEYFEEEKNKSSRAKQRKSDRKKMLDIIKRNQIFFKTESFFEQPFVTITIKQTEKWKKRMEYNWKTNFIKRYFSKNNVSINLADKYNFYLSLYMYSTWGINLSTSIHYMLKSTGSSKMLYLLTKIYDWLLQGTPFNEILKKFPNAFSWNEVWMIKVGEENGKLRDVYKVLKENIESQRKIRWGINQALIMPKVYIWLISLILVYLLWNTFPTLVKTFKDQGMELPGITNFFYVISLFIKENLNLVVIVAVIILLSLRVFISTSAWQKAFSYMIYKMPYIWSQFFRKYNLYLFINSLYLTIKTWVQQTEWLKYWKSSVSSFFQSDIEVIEALMLQWQTLWYALDFFLEVSKSWKITNHSNFFDLMFIAILKNWATSWQLEWSLENYLWIIREDLESSIVSLNKYIEVLWILFWAILVLPVILAMFLPIIKQTQELISKM